MTSLIRAKQPLHKPWGERDLRKKRKKRLRQDDPDT